MVWFDWKSRLLRKASSRRGRLPMQRSQVAIERLSRFRFFSNPDYTRLHPDIGTLSPAIHYVGYGADEGRQAARSVHIARTLGELANGISAPLASQGNRALHPPLTVGLYASSLGSVANGEIASALADLLRAAGHLVVEGDENSDIAARPACTVYVAPHEFFFLGRGVSWVRDEVLADACMYCTAPVQTPSFWKALHVVLMARCVVDMSMPVAAAFAEVMPAACILPFVGEVSAAAARETRDHPLLAGQRWWTEAEPAERRLDLCFFGAVSPSRARFFARNAERLARHEGVVYLRPAAAMADEAELSDVVRYVARNARVLLNVHCDEFPHFDWHRLVYQGMANGCAVISEPCLANPDFQPGIHYLAEEGHRLMDLLEWVIEDAEGREKAASVAAAASSFARSPEGAAKRAGMLADLLTA